MRSASCKISSRHAAPKTDTACLINAYIVVVIIIIISELLVFSIYGLHVCSHLAECKESTLAFVFCHSQCQFTNSGGLGG